MSHINTLFDTNPNQLIVILDCCLLLPDIPDAGLSHEKGEERDLPLCAIRFADT